jgi:DNA-binding transcriptional LysR family regulator
VEWSDIRVFLQVVRAGSMAAATGGLCMDHSTISRRIARLEREAGVPLFDRAGRRLVLTAEGDKLVLAAERLESIIIRDVMTLSEDHEHIAGHVRIGATEEFGGHYLASRLAELTAAHPELEIELVALPRNFSLTTREVDVVITLDRPLTGDVRFKKLTDFQLGVYGSAAYFGSRQRPAYRDDLARETWCGFIQDLVFTTQHDLLPSAANNLSVRYRTTSITVQLGATISGTALAVLPCFVAAPHPSLEQILPDSAVFSRTYWIAVHEDMAKHPRVRAVMKALETMVQRDRSLFAPLLEQPPAETTLLARDGLDSITHAEPSLVTLSTG